MTTQELIKLKEQITSAREKISRLEGKREHLLEELKQKWNCKSIKEAEKLIDKKNEELENLKNEIDTKSEELETQLNDATD